MALATVRNFLRETPRSLRLCGESTLLQRGGAEFAEHRGVKNMKQKKKILLLILLLAFGLWFYFLLPNKLFAASYSTVVLAQNGQLMGARIAEDEQWRFPLADSLPEKFTKAIITKEDKYFQYHLGVNPVSLFRALWLNIKEGKVVSGASTLSMQVIRLSRGNPPRTVLEKIYEIILATRLELGYSKNEILNLYASHAPFGGNVVGFEAASWRYFNRSPENLSWAECATLAVLPNAPGLIHPGRNRSSLIKKRDELLRELLNEGEIDEDTYALALLESIPDEPVDLPQLVLHLTAYLDLQQSGQRHSTSLDAALQEKAQQIVDGHLHELKSNHINNGALLLIENKTGAVKAYVGNVSNGKDFYNDMLRASRSSGSILKPFLYASMLSSGDLLPTQLVADVPTFLGGFRPQNFVNEFDGAVPADEALSRSLNIPAVLELKEFGIERFLRKLQQFGFSTISRSADHYGLSLVLGGAEVTAWDLGRAYYHMAASLNNYPATAEGDEVEIPEVHVEGVATPLDKIPVNVGAVYETFNVLTTLNRPDSEMGWQRFGNSNIAWKTGTSFGFRDAWAVGLTPEYTCVVWVGNADGEGRPGLIGAQAAGPILFSFMNSLPRAGWFETPWDNLTEKEICKISGMLAGRDCPDIELNNIPISTKAAEVCPYHKTIHTDRAGKYQLSINCAGDAEIHANQWFVLPAGQAWYYAKKHPEYQQLPPWKPGCGYESQQLVEVIYPKQNGRIFIPRELSGQSSKVVVEVAHQQPEEKLFWHLNGKYLGETQTFHQMALNLEKGDYELLVEDGNGNLAKRRFSVVERD